MAEEICNVFIPGAKPVYQYGNDTTDKLVSPSELFPLTKTFREALIDIKNENSSNI